MVTLKQLFEEIDKISATCVDFFAEIIFSVPAIQEKIERLYQGETLTQEELEAAQQDLQAIKDNLLAASTQFRAISPMTETPEENLPPDQESTPTPVPIPEVIVESPVELPVEITPDDSIGIPGVPSVDFVV